MACRLALVLSLGLAASGCASWHLRSLIGTDHIDFLTRALAADAQTRETWWRNAPPAKQSQGAALDRALLQSVPGHSGYDPMAAESALNSLINEQMPSDMEAVARLRLAELKTERHAAAECRQENAQLKQRLSRVVEIERKLNSNGH